MADQFFPELIAKGTDPETGADAFVNSNLDEYTRKTRYWLEAAFEEAHYEQAAHPEMQKMAKYIDYISGKQWPKQRPSYRASPVDNRIWRLLWELVSLLTDIRPIFEIRSTKKEYIQQAEMLNKVTRSWWLTSDSDLNLAMIILYAILTTGYGKLTWNEDLRNGEGDLELVPLSPSDVMPLKPQHTLQSSQAVIYKTLRPLGWFRQKFGARGSIVQPDQGFSRYATAPGRPAHIPAMIFDGLSPQMKRLVGRPEKHQQSSYPVAMYREFWLRDWTFNESNVRVFMGRKNANWSYWVDPGERLYPRGRLIAMGGEAIVYDGPNPYWHGMFPFEVLRMNAVPWQFMGASDLEPLIAMQDIVNGICAGILDMIKKAVNPGFYGPKQAFSDSQWEMMDWSMPGMKQGYNQLAGAVPQFAPSPNLPAFVMQFLGFTTREMDQSSGIAAITEALKKKQVPSGDVLERIKEAQQTPIRLKGRNIEVFLRNLGTQTIWNIFQFYTLQRRMFMLGSEGATFEDFDWDPGTAVPAGVKPEDHAKSFVFMLEPGSLLTAQRVEEAMVYFNLRKMGDMSRRGLYRKLDLGLDADKIERELKQEAMSGVPMIPQKKGKGGGGGGSPPMAA